MTHRFPIKEIANQSGLGPATVDRVLNNRANVSPQARARVAAAVKELEAQEPAGARGRRLFVDGSSRPRIGSAMLSGGLRSCSARHGRSRLCPRFVLQEQKSVDEVEATLKRIQKRGSQILKARDVPNCVRRWMLWSLAAYRSARDRYPHVITRGLCRHRQLGRWENSGLPIGANARPKSAAVLTTQSQDAFLAKPNAQRFATQFAHCALITESTKSREAPD